MQLPLQLPATVLQLPGPAALNLRLRRTFTWHFNVMIILIRCCVYVLDLLPFIACTSCQVLEISLRMPSADESRFRIPGAASEAILEPRPRSRKRYARRESSDH